MHDPGAYDREVFLIVAMLNSYQLMEVDFTANATGLSLFHCHQQVHMDFGFMARFDCCRGISPHRSAKRTE